MAVYGFSIQVDATLAPNTTSKLQTQLNGVSKNMKNINLPKNTVSNMKNLNNQTKLFSQNLVDAGRKFAEWLIIGKVIMGAINTVRDGIQTIVELDSALVELRKVTSLTNDELVTFTAQAMEMGDVVARTTQEIIQGASDFARAGYDAQTALDLSQQAAMMVNIGDGIDSVNEATSAMIATLKGFNMETSETMHILDAVNEVSNNFAVDSGDLVTGIQTVSATMASANNSFEETIGLITGVTEVIRDASRASTGKYVCSHVQKCA